MTDPAFETKVVPFVALYIGVDEGDPAGDRTVEQVWTKEQAEQLDDEFMKSLAAPNDAQKEAADAVTEYIRAVMRQGDHITRFMEEFMKLNPPAGGLLAEDCCGGITRANFQEAKNLLPMFGDKAVVIATIS